MTEVLEDSEVIGFLEGITFNGVPSKDWNKYVSRAIELIRQGRKFDKIYHEVKNIISSHSLIWLEKQMFGLEEKYFSEPMIDQGIEEVFKRNIDFLKELKKIGLSYSYLDSASMAVYLDDTIGLLQRGQKIVRDLVK